VYKIIHLAVFVGADLCLRVRPDSALLGRQTAEWSELAIFIGQNALKAEMAENDLSLNFVCPTCGVKPQEKCELKSGVPRFASHVERWDIAKDHRPKPRLTKPPPAQKIPKQ
jgi:hypothetical protein